jgi:predicted enzyme related to lactoylglutathione lyase
MEAVDVHGRFMWHQLLTRDMARARSFYSKLVGWKAQPWPLDPAFTIWSMGDAPTAGLMEMTPEVPAEAPSHWLQYIGTRDVDGTAEAAVRAGGSILKPPSDMKGAGRYAVLRDPQGAVFAIIDPENARPEPAGNPPPLGTFSWHELATSDNEAAFAFYSSLFGWDAITRMDMGENVGVYLIFGQNGVQKGGMYIKAANMTMPPNWTPYAHVPSVDEAAKFIKANGGTIWQEPMEVPGGSRIAIFCDPTGAACAVHSYPATAVAAAAEQPKPKAAAKVKAKPKARTKPKPKPKPKMKPKAKVKSRARPKAKAKARRKVKAKAKAKAKVRKKSPAKARAKSARRKK